MQVVSTKVGGIPEILPESMITLCEPSVLDLIDKVEVAIKKIETGEKIDALMMHEEIKKMYNWRDVAKRTQTVYDLISKKPNEDSLIDKIIR